MTDADLLVELLQTLSAPQAKYAELERYYTGTQALSFLSAEAKTALARFDRMASNIPRLSVTSLAERLRVTGFSGVDIWDDWLANNLDQLSGIAHREALLLGDSYVIVWADPSGKPRVSVESAKQIAVLTDPGSRETVAAVKQWRTKKTTEAVVYLPDRIQRWRANTPGAATAGFDLVGTIDNPLNVVPVVQLRNTDRLLTGGSSEISDLIPLIDGLNKLLLDLLVSSEYTGRPRRWATGIELVERPRLDDDGNAVLDGDGIPIVDTVNPIPEGSRAMIAEDAGAKFGSLPGADLQGYESGVRVLLGQIMATSSLPAHYVGVLSDQPTSADALRASEASLTARAEARQQSFGRAWEQVANLIVAVRDGVDIGDVAAQVQWADAATRSVAQEADSVTKLFQVGLLPASYALQRLGYTDDEIIAIRAARRTEGLDAQGVDLAALPPRANVA